MPTGDSPPPALISVRVLLFATYADLVGRPSVDVELPGPATVADVVRHLRQSVPGASRLPERPLAAVNQVHAQPNQPVSNGAELALLPPMAGG